MAASAVAVAAARALINRLAHNAVAATSSSSAPVTTSAAAAAANVMIRGVADNAAAATSTSSSPSVTASAVAAARVTVRWLAHIDAAATSSPPSSSSASEVTVRDPSARTTSTAADPSTAPPATPQKISTDLCLHISSRRFSSSPTPTPPPPDGLYLRNVRYMIDLLDGLVLSTEDEKLFREAFNEKFNTFKVADLLTSLEKEDLTVEEYCILLKMIYAKLGANRGLAELLLNEDINVCPTNDEIAKNPQLSRLECKMDILTKKFIEGNADILQCVRGSNKGEWGTVEVYGRKLDLTKLEFVRKLINIITGV